MALTATALPALGLVKLTLNWAPYRNELVHLYRVEPDGATHEILGSPITLSGSDAIAYDTVAPLDVPLTYEAVLSNPTVVRDDFTRSVSSGWGAPEFSTVAGNWSVAGGSTSDFSTNGTLARMSHSAAATGHVATSPVTGLADARIGGTVTNPVTPLGASIRTSVMTRYVDQNNHYQFNVVHAAAGGISLSIIKRVGGTETTIASTLTSFTVSPNRQFRIVAESVGTKHRMWVWWATGEADAALLEVSDSTFTAAGRVGFRSVLSSGNTNTLPVVLTFDSAIIQDLSTYTFTSGTVTVTASPHGWIRDPQVPANSIRLDNCADHTFDCLTSNQMVFFRGFGDDSYRSTSGVFDIVNAERPTVVAQTRKDLVTDLLFASVTLADIDRVKTLFKSGRNLALSLDPEYGWGMDSYGTAMFTAGDLNSTRLNRKQFRKPYRLWSTEVAVTDLDDDLPAGTVGNNGIPIPGATFGDLKATGKTFGQIKATGNTFLDIAQGDYS